MFKLPKASVSGRAIFQICLICMIGGEAFAAEAESVVRDGIVIDLSLVCDVPTILSRLMVASYPLFCLRGGLEPTRGQPESPSPTAV